MGGINSGRYRTRNRGMVEDTCRIDLRYLRRVGALKAGVMASGTLRWSNQYGDERGSLGYVVDLTAGNGGTLTASYSFKGEPRRVVVRLAATPMRYGGFRFYAECPLTGRRCEVLPVVAGVIACRQAHRLNYGSQSLDQLGRLRERAWKLEKRLNPSQAWKPKPRGANRARIREAWINAEGAFDEAFGAMAVRRFGTLW